LKYKLESLIVAFWQRKQMWVHNSWTLNMC